MRTVLLAVAMAALPWRSMAANPTVKVEQGKLAAAFAVATHRPAFWLS
jgi:hypothetical protein